MPELYFSKARQATPTKKSPPKKDSASSKGQLPDEAVDDPSSLFSDPYAIVRQLGYKDKPSNITYGTLSAMTWRMPIVRAIIKTRVQQMAAFTRPSRSRYDIGFKFQKRSDPTKALTAAERKWAEEMTRIMLQTGVTDNPRGRDSFKTFMTKVMTDSMTYDQACIEVVPDRRGLPAEWYAVDAASIRVADVATTRNEEDDTDAVSHVQIYDGLVIAEFNQEEMCFGVRNPQTDLRLHGYGVAELENLVKVVTALLWAWDYNQNAFSQGSVHKGILNFKGAVSERQLRDFRRLWYSMLSGVENSWKTPIVKAEELQWVPMHSTNRDMEYNAWFDFLLKVTCSMYDMDPIEINFKYGNTGQSSGGLGEQSNREKINESRARGLRPLLTSNEEWLNRAIIWPLNPEMELVYAGLDAMTRTEAATLNATRVKTTHTVNELRAEDGEKPVEGGDIILDPVWAQAQANAAAAAEAEAGGGGPDFGGDGGDDDEDPDFAAMLRGFGDDTKKEEPTKKALVDLTL